MKLLIDENLSPHVTSVPLYNFHQCNLLHLRERPLIVMECSVIAE